MLDYYDQEVVGWTATTGGISREMIRDMMIEYVERRFGSVKTTRGIEWLTDNGLVYATNKTVEIDLALGLTP